MSNYGWRLRVGRLVWTVLVALYFGVFFTNFLADALPGSRLVPNIFAIVFVLWLGIEYYFGAPFFQSGIVEHSAFWRGVFAVFVYPFIGFVAADHIWLRWTQLPLPALGGAVGLVLFLAGTLVRLDVLFGLLRIMRVKSRGREQVVTIPEKLVVGLRLFRVSRHPRDLGTFVQLLGIALVFSSWGGVILAVVIGLPLILVQVRHDDALLSELLGKEADHYFTTTPLFFPRCGHH